MRLTLFTRIGTADVEAFPTATPGLVIHRHLDDPELWTITHKRSGLAVAVVDGSEWAQALAAELGRHANWTRPGEELMTLFGELKPVIAEFGRIAAGPSTDQIRELRRR